MATHIILVVARNDLLTQTKTGKDRDARQRTEYPFIVRLIKIVRPSSRVTDAVARRRSEEVRRNGPMAEAEDSSASASCSSSAQKVLM